MTFRSGDFKSPLYTIPSPRRISIFNLEATEGFAPSHNGFADRRVASSPRGRGYTVPSVGELVHAAAVLVALVYLKFKLGDAHAFCTRA